MTSPKGSYQPSCLKCMGIRTDAGQLPIHAQGCPGTSPSKKRPSPTAAEDQAHE